MKNCKCTFIAYIYFFIFFILSSCYAQECTTALETSAPLGFIGGLYKPHNTDTSALNIIIIFAQHPDDTIPSSDWPIGSPPNYMDSLLSPTRKNASAFWNNYSSSNEVLSDYYQETSLGKFHVIGITRHYIYDHVSSWYGGSETIMNNEIYNKLQADENILWRDFDRWSYISPGIYEKSEEGHVDYITIVRRNNEGPAGEAGLDGTSFTIDPSNQIDIRTGLYQLGSGSIINGNNPGPHGYNRFFGICIHELGHFLWGDHSAVGIMTSRGGNSINDLFASPFEKIKLGYLVPKVVLYNQTPNYSIGDISCRTSNNEILKVPISSNEYFIIENRRKISKYDVKMLGDTTKFNMLTDVNSYGTGVYIYHHRSTDLAYPGNQDEECADGLFNWQYAGTNTPDWSNSQQVICYVRTSIPSPLQNDPGIWGSYLNRDDQSMAVSLGDGVEPMWFSLGLRHITVPGVGTDKTFTNSPEYWTSRAAWGDRKDAWNIGYNEIFSPYSNPNTKTWNNSNSGIFIQYSSLSSGVANFKIYHVDSSFTESEILAATPPSRPMGIDMQVFYPLNSSTCHPKNNLES